MKVITNIKEAFYVDKVLIPSRKGRIILYSIVAVGFTVAFIGMFCSNDYSILMIALGLCLAIMPCCEWMSRATRYILDKEKK